MRNLKKLFAVIVTIAMIATFAIPAFAAVPADVKGTDYEGAVTRLVSLGVITGYPDGNFGPNDSITRAQAAAVLVRALGYESIAESAKGVTKFSDVAASYWGAGYINLAVSLNLIKGYGNGKFGPEDKVTYDQVVTMVVRALGQDYAAELKGGFPTGYLLQAKVIGFTDGTKGVSGTNATRGIVAQLVDNAKDKAIYIQTTVGSSQTYEPKGGTFLEKLGMTPVKDVIVTKTPASGSDANKLTAAGVEYESIAGAFDYESVLGKKVTLWKNSDGKVVLAQATAGTDVVIKELKNYTVASGVYSVTIVNSADEEKTYTTTVEPSATFNLKAGTAANAFAQVNVSGIKDKTDKYDVTLSVDGDTLLFAKVLKFDSPAKIDAPVVNTVAKSIKIGSYFVKKGDKMAKNLVIVKDGAKVDYTALAKDDVIMVAKNPGTDDTVADDDYFYITATSKTVSGKLVSAKPSQTAATSIKIASTSYDIGQFVNNATGALDVSGMLDSEVKATLDPLGKVLAVESTTSSSADKYGVIIGTSYNNTLGDEVYQVRILTAAGDKVTYDVTADNLKAAILAANGSTPITNRLIKYYINSDGDMSTVEFSGAGETGLADVNKFKLNATYVKSDVVVFAHDGSTGYKVIKWADIDDDTTATASNAFKDNSLEYTALLMGVNGYTSTGDAGKYAYTTDKTAIKDGKYIIDLVNKSGAASLTTADTTYANAGNAIVYTLGKDGAITISNTALAKAAVTGTEKLTVTEVASNRIKVKNDTTGVESYFYFTDDSIIVYDKDADGGSGVDKLTKTDVYTDMVIEVYTTVPVAPATSSNDIAVLVITEM